MDTIFLRAFEPDDYILINKWRNDPEIQKLTAGTFRYVSSEMEKQWVHEKMMNNTKDIYLAICLNDESREMIGYISLNNIDYIHRSVHSGGIVIGNKKYRDGGTMRLAGGIVSSYVFNTLNMNRYAASCLADHINSRVMMEAGSMKLEGIQREAIYKAGKYHDLCLYSILRSEYYEIEQNGAISDLEYAKEIKRIRDNYRKK